MFPLRALFPFLVLGLTSPVGWAQSQPASLTAPVMCVGADPEDLSSAGTAAGEVSLAKDAAGAANPLPLCQPDPAAAPEAALPLEEALMAPQQDKSRAVDTVLGTVEPLVRHAVMDSLEGVLSPPGSDMPGPATEKIARPVDDVGRTVEAWLQAWSERNADAYLGHYSPEFSTGEPGFSFAQWSQQRRQRLLKQPWIAVKALEMRVEPAGTDQAQVRFKQDYRSPALTEITHKRLVLRRQGSSWRIVSERAE